MITKRKMLASAAVFAAAASLGACAYTTNPSTGVSSITLSPSVNDFIQSAVAAAAQYIPTIESIAATAAGLFGPTYAAIVQAGSSALNAVVAALVGVVAALPPAASTALRQRLRASSPRSPVVIGTTSGGITVVGYRV